MVLAVAAPLPGRADDGCPGVFVFFAPGSSRLDHQARLILNNSAIWMVQAVREGRGGAWVEIVGTTDDHEAKLNGRRLSQRRANKVLDYLIGRGIPKEFIRATGAGVGAALTVDESVDRARATERRVQAGLGMTREAWQRAFPPGAPVC